MAINLKENKFVEKGNRGGGNQKTFEETKLLC